MAIETLDAKLSKILFHQPSRFDRAGTKFLIARTSCGRTVKGSMEQPIEELRYRFYGESRPQKGRDEEAFEFSTYEEIIESGADGLTNYLRRKIAGIGQAKARAIVDHFGDEALSVLMAAPDRLSEVPGITPAIIETIKASLADRSKADPVSWVAVANLFEGHKVSEKIIDAIVKDFGPSAVDQVRKLPYATLIPYRGMGWVKVDAIATTNLAYDPTGLDRHCAGIMEAIHRLCNDQGHTLVSRVDAAGGAHELLGHRPKGEAWDALESERRIIVRGGTAGEEVAPADLADAEWSIAWRVDRLSRAAKPLDPIEIKPRLGRPPLNADQLLAVAMIEDFGVSILAGAPGTGKSYTMAEVIAALWMAGYRNIRVVAPTGKAAKRAAELIAGALPGATIPCTTIHKALAPSPSDAAAGTPSSSSKVGRGRDEFQFAKNEADPLDVSVLFIDECFPAGTLVDTPEGPIDIALIRPGQPILNAAGVDRVIAVGTKEVHRGIQIHTGEQTIVASERHPFFTARGVVLARNLRPGDSLLKTASAMRLLRGDADDGDYQGPAFLRSTLQHAMVDEVPRIQVARPHGGAQPQMRREAPGLVAIGRSSGRGGITEDRHTQSHGAPGSPREDIGRLEGDLPQTSDPGRQRTWTDKGRGGASLRAHRLDAQPHRPNQDGAVFGVSDPLQARLGGAIASDLHRGGWGLAPLDRTTGAGPEEDGVPQYARVDRVEVLEPGDPRLDRFRDARGKLYFYDLQAARHQSFSVAGLLVHNCSMVDTKLMASLLKAVPDGARLVFVGDPNQLPSVGPGSVLRDLIASGLPSTILDKIVRSDGGGSVVRACHAIKAGLRPEPAAKVSLPTDNWVHIEVEEIDAIAAEILSLCRSMKAFPDPVWDIQVVSPIYKGAAGCNALNEALGKHLNPVRADESPDERWPFDFRRDDKVVRTKNGAADELIEAKDNPPDFHWRGKAYETSEISVVNGDMGTVLDFVEGKDPSIVVRFRDPDRLCRVPADEHYLSAAYALTCHKAQGSGFPVVIVPVHNCFPFNPATQRGVWTKEWLYTAMSRAEKLLITVGQSSAISKAISRKTLHLRNTRLQQCIELATAEVPVKVVK